jgi:hypothetical protein
MMTVSRSRSALFGAVLALVAMLGFAALSGWHSATIHDDDGVQATTIEHSHEHADRDNNDDPDGPIHVAAHATGQGLALTGHAIAAFLRSGAEIAWISFDSLLRSGIDPSELLRPPRS